MLITELAQWVALVRLVILITMAPVLCQLLARVELAIPADQLEMIHTEVTVEFVVLALDMSA